MKVGIITFHNGSNYGAALQSFALQEAEKKICNDVYIDNKQTDILKMKIKSK